MLDDFLHKTGILLSIPSTKQHPFSWKHESKVNFWTVAYVTSVYVPALLCEPRTTLPAELARFVFLQHA